MADLKTKVNTSNVADFLANVTPDQKKQDSLQICTMMQEITGCDAEMWGSSIVGFGRYKYVYESGRKGEWMLVGFSPRKQNITLYIMPGFSRYEDLLARLGKHSTGKSCLYIKRLSDIDLDILKTLITDSVTAMKKKYNT
ncbi:MAG: DUF1801 domain-containing protein [Acidobacteria bacterium]|nr:DUF1801 domain-containing protein [Acidobacteriota bacterium]